MSDFEAACDAGSPASHGSPTRVESDALGDVRVPAHVHRGAHTARALDDFRVSGARCRTR
ncbi:hypothetical protein [Streptomyces sp. NPDC021608]|uniref:hypothetical protein n=1 Tax=Streptomyces sp. NPDC021608 TaxID=3154903 RepID=UPI003403E5BE